MSYFLPTYFQKRLLRYALSQLELLDTDALDLDKLDIAWGKRSTVEIRDVALHRKKITSLSSLSQVLELTEAKVLVLRVTVPADIYSSAIIVEVEGVLVRARVLPVTHSTIPTESSAKSRARRLHSRDRRDDLTQSRTIGLPKHDGRKLDTGSRPPVEGDEGFLPTTVDLALSFLQAEPSREKAELKTAVESQLTVLSDEENDSAEVGTGTGLTLPGFLAGFLKGVKDRLEVRIKDICVDLEMDIDVDGPAGREPTIKADQLTLRLQVETVLIEGVTPGVNVQTKGSEKGNECASSGLDNHGSNSKRRIFVKDIHFVFISDHTLFTTPSRFAGGSAPATTQFKSTPEPNEGADRICKSSTSISPVSSGGKGHDRKIPTPITSIGQVAPIKSAASMSTIQHGMLEDSNHDSASANSDFNSLRLSTLNRHIDSRYEGPTLSDRASHTSLYYNVSEGIPIRSLVNDVKDPSEGVELENSHAFHQSDSQCHSALGEGTAPRFESFSITPHKDKSLESLPLQSDRLHPIEPPVHSTTSQRSQMTHTDNLAHSMQASNYAARIYDQNPSAAYAEDLSVSRVFSHDEAESMYMSAISQVTPAESKRMAALELPVQSSVKADCRNLPLNEEFVDTIDDQHLCQPFESKAPSEFVSAVFRGDNEEEVNPAAFSPEPEQKSSTKNHSLEDSTLAGGILGAEATSQVWNNDKFSSNFSETNSTLRKQVLYIDQVDFSIPCSGAGGSRSEGDHVVHDSNCIPEYGSPNTNSQSLYSNIPGAFSIYAQRSQIASEAPSVGQTLKPDMTREKSSKITDLNATGWEPRKKPECSSIQINVGCIDIDLDISVGRSLAITTHTLKATFETHDTGDKKRDTQQAGYDGFTCNMSLRRVSCRLHEHIAGVYSSRNIYDRSAGLGCPPELPSGAEVLLRSTIDGLDVRYSFENYQSSTQIFVEKFLLGHSEEDIISFDANLKLRESIRDISSPLKKDVSISMIRTGNSQRFSIHTLPVQLSLNLEKIDEILNWFGGLSGILELGNSIASSATTVGPDSSQHEKQKPNRSVHFHSITNKPTAFSESKTSAMKIDARLGGAQVNLIGKDCTFVVKSSALKFVSRGECGGLQVDKLVLSGPHLRHGTGEESTTAVLNNTRIEYLPVPGEADLGRLLFLLAPSKSKYDEDDDILLETLLRQRRKGSLIRSTIESIHGSISCLEDIAYLSNLATEVASLSKVAKYLPEDDRPGILVLTLVREVDMEVYVDESIGHIKLALQNLESANVGLPLLMAIGIEVIRLHRNQDEELIGMASFASSHTHHSEASMVMIRVVGDELEPTIRIKLWNVRIEYSVPLLMALTAESNDKVTESVMKNLVNSVVTVAANQPQILPSSNLSRPSSPGPGLSMKRKLPKLEISLLDCIVGLSPGGLPSKGLVVLTDTRLSGTIRSTGELEAVLKIHKTSILVIDDARRTVTCDVRGTSAEEHSQVVHDDQISRLCRMGFVSVGYISSAKASVFVTNFNTPGIMSADVDLRDDLFVLETCADSTQTLLGIINGLKPPVTPSKDTKYRTEIIPVQDMLASLSGDAFAPTTLFGKDDPQIPLDLEEGDMVNDEVPRNLEYVNSFYRPEPQISSEDIADSILEDDLGHLVNLPVTREIGDRVLLESFREQYQVAAGGEPLDFREDHFGTKTIHSDTKSGRCSEDRNPAANNTSDARPSPLRVRVRDVHIIWKLYDGYDWQRTRDTISKVVKEVEKKASTGHIRNDSSTQSGLEDEQESVIGDYLFNSIYIGIPAKRDPRDLTGLINRNVENHTSETESCTTSNVSKSPRRNSPAPRPRGKRLRLGRSKHHKMSFELRGVSLDLAMFAADAAAPPEEVRSSLDVRVKDFEIFDHVPTSTWKKFATYMRDAGERQSGSDMVHLEILTVKPVPELEATEIKLKATVLPLRLHVDQDALDFITRFFEFKDDEVAVHTPSSDIAFISRVEVNSVRLRLDYKPKKVDYAGLRSGHTTEFMNFFILDRADMVLRHVIIHGISGFEKLSKTLNDIWMPDIIRNQLPGVLAGLAPFRSIVGVGGGVRDLVAVPMREYRKDGRIVGGIQKGAVAFAKITTSELVKLGAKLAIGTQTVLEGAEDLFVEREPQDLAAWEDAELDEVEKKTISLYADQPVGVVQGLRGAYAGLERDLATFRDAIVAVPGEVLDSGSAQGAAKAVLRRAPTVIFRPAIGASKAISQTLLGATNSLDPQNQRRIEDKYKKH